MKKLTRNTLIMLAAAVAVFSILVLAAQVLVNTRSSRAWISRKIEAAVGARVGFRTISFALLPAPSLTLHQPWLSVSGVARGRAESLRVQPAVWSSLFGHLRLEKILLLRPRVQIDIRPTAESAGLPPGFSALAERFRPQLQKMANSFAGTQLKVVAGQLDFPFFETARFNLEKVQLTARVTKARTIGIALEASSGFVRSMRFKLVLDPETFASSARVGLQGLDLQAVANLIPGVGDKFPRGRVDLDLEAAGSANKALSARMTLAAADFALGGGPEKLAAKGLKAVAEITRDLERTEVKLKSLQLNRPGIDMSAVLAWRSGRVACKPELTADVRFVAVDDLKPALTAALGADGFWNRLFTIVKGGQISDLKLSSQGSTWQDLFTLDSIVLSAILDSGSLAVPVLDWNLEQVSGKVTLEDGILSGRDLTASRGETRASGGTLRLGLGNKEVFSLACNFKADLAQVPGLVRRFAGTPAVLAELRRVGSLTGTAAGYLVVKQTGKSWQLKISADQLNLEAAYDRLPGKLRVRRGRLVFSGRQLEVDQVEGSCGQSVFSGLKGRINWSGSPAIDLRQATLRLNLGQLYSWGEPLLARFAGGFKVQGLSGWADVTHLSLKGPLAEPFRWKLKAGVSLDNLWVDSMALPACLEIERADLSLDSGNLVFSDLSMSMAETVIGGSGAVKGLFTSDPQLELSLKGRVGRTFRAWLLRTFHFPNQIRAGRSMIIDNLSVSAGKDLFTLEAEAKLASELCLSLAMSLRQSELNISRLLLQDEATDALVALRHSLGSSSWYIDFSGKLAAETLGKLWELPMETTGEISGKGYLFLDQAAPGASSFNGHLEISQVSIAAGILAGVRVDHAFVSGKGDRISVKRAKVHLFGDSLSGAGRLEMKRDSIYLDLRTRAAVLHAGRIQKAFAGQDVKSRTQKLVLPPIKGVVAFELERLQYGKHAWEPFNAMAMVDGKKVSLRFLDAKICGISVAGSIKLAPDGAELNLTPRLEKTKLRYPLGCLAGADTSERIEGSLEVSGHLVTSGNDQQQLLANLNGRLSVNISDGRVFNIGNAGLFTNIISYLKINRLATGDLPDLRKRDLPFESISARMVFKGGKIMLENARVKARSINVVCEGEMDMANQTMNLTMLVSPLTSIDWIISHTPVVGKILKGTLVAIPVSVMGDLRDPKVIPLAPQAVGARILGILERTIRAPFELIQPILPKTPPARGADPVEEEDGYGH